MGVRERYPVKARFLLFLGIVVAVLGTLMSAILMFTVHRMATDSLTNTVTAAATEVAALIPRGQVQTPIPDGVVHYIQVINSQHRVVAATKELLGRPPIASFVPSNVENESTSVVCGRVFPSGQCQLVVAVQAIDNGKLWTIYGAAPMIPFYVDPLLAMFMVSGIVLTVGLIIFSSYRIVVGCLEPVETIRANLHDHSPARLGHRIPVPSASHREAHDLANTVNHTLDQIQSMMEGQRQFTFDISHDLRSPITAMRAQVEDALLAPLEVDVSRMGHALLASLDRLQAIVSDLLMLAKLDAGIPTSREPVDLADLVTAECDRPHSGKDIVCEPGPAVVVNGDRLRLARLVNNLVDNAVRHSSSRVTLRVSRQPGDLSAGARLPGLAVLEVLDDGGGVPPGDRDSVFKRFIRLEEGRRRDPNGTGLGLPIARQIAECHDGTLTIEDSLQGARFVLRLPLAVETAPFRGVRERRGEPTHAE
jgi:signal transduction histidine kinase